MAEPWPAAWRLGNDLDTRPRRVTRAQALAGVAAPAKLNLGLAVTGRRTDGYHKLATLFATLALADTVRVEPADDFALACDNPALVTDDNLCLRAALALHAATGTRTAARITLTKHIPIAAGLGGGSSDAAATLLALDALWETDLSDEALFALAKSLGADVPFLLCGGASIARGIGDLLWPAVPVPPAPVLLVVPRVEIPRKTAALYAALSEADYGDDNPVRRQMAAVRERNALDPVSLDNAFLSPLERLAPVVSATRAAMAAAGLDAHLSGSGPALYALCKTDAEAERSAVALRGHVNAEIIVTRLQP